MIVRPNAADAVGVVTAGPTIWSRIADTLASSSGERSRITPLEGIRGYAVLLVFLVHHHTLFGAYLPEGSVLYRISNVSHTIGNSGVDLFFVLSGYLIYGHLLRSAPSYGTFLRRRIRRIYPTFLAVFAIYVLLAHVSSNWKIPAGWWNETLYIIENLLLLPGIFPIEPLITVCWSLSYEFLFYLTVPLLVGLTGMRRWQRRWRVAAFVSVILVHCIGYQLKLLPHIRMNMFLAGMLVYEAADSGWGARRASRPGEWRAIVVYVSAMAVLGFTHFGRNGTPMHPVVPAVWTALLCLALSGIVLYSIVFSGFVSRIFSSAPLRLLGNMSYSYFLVHGLALNATAYMFRAAFPGNPQSAALFAALFILNLALTLIASYIVYMAVERPFSILPRRARKGTVRAVAAQSGGAGREMGVM